MVNGRWVRRFAAIVGVIGTSLALTSPPGSAAPVASEAPTALRVTARSTLAMVSWSSPRVASWLVEVADDLDFAGARRIEESQTLTALAGLTPATGYFVRVSSRDASGAVIGTSTAARFTTRPADYPSPAPTVALEPRSATALEANWTAVPLASGYQVALSTDPADATPTLVPAEGLTTTLAKLDQRTTYHVRVRGLDGSGAAVSDWSMPAKLATVDSLPMRVASYNIKCANCSQGKSWAERRTAVVATIKGQQPDVLGVQEASQGNMTGTKVAQFEDLIRRLGNPYALTNSYRYNCANSKSPNHCRYVDRGSGMENRIIYNTTTMELVKQGSEKLPTTSAANIDRYLAWAILRQKATGKEFLFANTHLEPSSSFQSLRVRQTSAILSHLKALRGGSLPTIVVGDFNTHKWIAGGNRPYDQMLANGYLDPLGNSYKSHWTAPGAFVEKRIRTNYSTSNRFERKAPRLPYLNGTYLDYIFVTRMRVSEWETVVKVDARGNFVGLIPSDHNMIRATVWLP